jgi:hypothetical protein
LPPFGRIRMVALYSRKYARTGRRSEAQATPGTLEELGTNYKKRDIVSLNISGRFGPEAADKFKKDLADSLRSGQTYSHLKSSGATCSASIFKAFLSLPAKGETFGLWWSKVIYKVAGSAFSPFLPLGLLNVIPPSFIYVVAKEMEVRVAHDATVGTRVDLTGVVNAGDNAELAGLAGALALAGANPSLSPEAPVSRQPPTDDEEEPSQQALQDPSDDEDHEDHEDHEDALPGDSPQDPETDEDDDGKDLEDLEDLEEEARLASDS